MDPATNRRPGTRGNPLRGVLAVTLAAALAAASAHATDLVSNRAFVLKLVLISGASANAAAFHVGVYRSAAQWDRGAATPPAAKLHAAASLGIWTGVIACGRLLAYL